MLSLFKKLSQSQAAYRAASYALAMMLVAGAHAAIAARAAQIFV